MKKLTLALAGAAVFAFAGGAQAADLPLKAAPVAQQPISGYVGLYVGGTWWDETYNPSSGNAFVFGGEGRLNYWVLPTLSVQIDMEAEATTQIKINGGNNVDGRIHGVIGGHVAWRNPSVGTLGAFGAFSGANNLDYQGQMVHGMIGVEGQRYFNMLTLYGQAGWAGRITGSDEYEPQALWFVRGVGRYFLTPNDKIQVEIGYADGPEIYATDTRHHITNWGVLYEHKFSNPFSAYVEYAGFNTEATNDGYRATEHMVMVGLRAYLNQGTLLSNDRNGATFDLPKFVRALPWSYMIAP